MAGVAINTFTAICSGKSAYKYGSETVGMMKTTVPNVKTDLRTIKIETYDWAYIVVCNDFEFAITGQR